MVGAGHPIRLVGWGRTIAGLVSDPPRLAVPPPSAAPPSSAPSLPTGVLPVTGTDSATPLRWALVLVLVGSALLIVRRVARRKV